MSEMAMDKPELVTVELGGVLGKNFGKVHRVAANTVRRAVSIIDCNRPGLVTWMKMNAKKYQKYHISVERHDGAVYDMSEAEFQMENNGSMKSIRITPIYRGSGSKVVGAVQVVVGVILMVVAVFASSVTGGASLAMFSAGFAMAFGGVAALLSKQPSNKMKTVDNKDSYYFDGPQNTVSQGNPVQLIYGKEILVGSQIVSVKMSVEQML
ncbi:tail assembly protein [Cronobacter sp. JZ38]|uniref:tail assembly protein n=1 Tax=Cronobacter sp. JZ38 TaxID=1906275 RepID=UPI0015583008|nr:tail assembly protein [Cronobacter sp. JZ38]